MSSRMVLSLAFACLLVGHAPAMADEPPDDDPGATPPKPVVDIAPLPPELRPSPASAPAAAPAGSPVDAATPPTVARWTLELVAHAPAGKQPTSCVIGDDGATLLVSNRGDNSVSVFDTERLDPKSTITDVGYSAWGLALPPDGTLLVANWAGSAVAVIDRESGKRVGEIPVGMKPSYLALSKDGKRVHVAGSFGGDVAIAAVASRRNLRQIDAGRRPMGVVLSPDERWLYVAACESKLIQRVDLKHEVVLDGFGCDLAQTTNLAITPDGRTILAAGDGGRLLLVDSETGRVDKVAAGGDISSVAITPDGRTVLATDYLNDTVVFIDLWDRKVWHRLPVGSGPIHVETDGKRLYVCNDKAGTVSAFDMTPVGGAAAQP